VSDDAAESPGVTRASATDAPHFQRLSESATTWTLPTLLVEPSSLVVIAVRR
jgi:hypothetical protein